MGKNSKLKTSIVLKWGVEPPEGKTAAGVADELRWVWLCVGGCVHACMPAYMRVTKRVWGCLGKDEEFGTVQSASHPYWTVTF